MQIKARRMMMVVQYCKKCVMPNTRPGITFDSDGICMPCKNHEKKKKVDYNQRFEELKKLCDKYRGMNGNAWDCAIAVSGGKDSHFQVHIMKELMGMNPILFSVEDNFNMTEAGKHNLKNISEEFGCNLITIKPDLRTQKRVMRKTFEKYGKPTWFIDRLIYTYPIWMSLKFNTPLLVYGEDIGYEYGGADSEEKYSAREILENGVASDIPYKELLGDGVTMKDLEFTTPPPISEMNKLDPIYLSYFVEWNSYSNYIFAKSRGLHDLTHEWDRTMCVENFDQVDSRGYLVHAWMKYPKFGHACATDYTSRFIRYGMLSRDEAVELVKQKDHALDPKVVEDFCQFMGYRESEFWEIVDRFYNLGLFEKDSFGKWVLKNPVWRN